jgi:hypothetical protein
MKGRHVGIYPIGTALIGSIDPAERRDRNASARCQRRQIGGNIFTAQQHGIDGTIGKRPRDETCAPQAENRRGRDTKTVKCQYRGKIDGFRRRRGQLDRRRISQPPHPAAHDQNRRAQPRHHRYPVPRLEMDPRITGEKCNERLTGHHRRRPPVRNHQRLEPIGPGHAILPADGTKHDRRLRCQRPR